MSYRDTTDTIAEALLTALVPAINTDLAAELSVAAPNVDAIVKGYNHPIPLHMAPVLQLPALLIYRASTRWHQSNRRRRRLSTFNVDYIGPQMPDHSIGEIWSLLHRVFEAVAKNMVGRNDAQIVEVYQEQSAVIYNFAPGANAKNIYPVFSSTWPILHDPRVPNATPVVGENPFQLEASITKGPHSVNIVTPKDVED